MPLHDAVDNAPAIDMVVATTNDIIMDITAARVVFEQYLIPYPNQSLKYD